MTDTVGRHSKPGDHAMIATQCLTAQMIEVGARHVARLSFSHEQVAQYCALTGDRNAIHYDLEAARLRFPETRDIIVPGGLIQSTVSGLFGTELPGDGSLGLSFTPERLRRPVCPLDELVVVLEVTRIRGGLVEIDVTVEDLDGNRITTAKAKVVAPDDAYRAWWERRTNESMPHASF
jgi:acyl dehydratase